MEHLLTTNGIKPDPENSTRPQKHALADRPDGSQPIPRDGKSFSKIYSKPVIKGWETERRGKEGKKFQFGKEERKAFNEMKAAISKDTFLGYMTQANQRSLNVVQVRKVCEQYLLKKGDLSATHLEH